jgi:prevent-host-death family protein
MVTTTAPEIRTAADGVQEVPLTRARAALTTLIEQAREDGVVSALTVRGRRRVVLVTPDWYERAKAALGEAG